VCTRRFINDSGHIEQRNDVISANGRTKAVVPPSPASNVTILTIVTESTTPSSDTIICTTIGICNDHIDLFVLMF
jgi:hypothetical protein